MIFLLYNYKVPKSANTSLIYSLVAFLICLLSSLHIFNSRLSAQICFRNRLYSVHYSCINYCRNQFCPKPFVFSELSRCFFNACFLSFCKYRFTFHLININSIQFPTTPQFRNNVLWVNVSFHGIRCEWCLCSRVSVTCVSAPLNMSIMVTDDTSGNKYRRYGPRHNLPLNCNIVPWNLQ